jgi:hypothetical protein
MTSKTGRPRIAVVAALLCATTASAQENRGTPCARRLQLCAGHIPDPTKVEHCLSQNKSDLSDACRLVFEQRQPGGQRKQITESAAPLGARPKSYANAAETPCVPATRS